LSHTPPQRASNDAEVIERLTPVHERLNKELTKWPKKSPKHKEAKDARFAGFARTGVAARRSQKI
jgi:hypothetical protein